MRDPVLYVVGVFTLFSASMFGATVNGCIWRHQSIKRGYAEYNSQTGDWQWKELKPESEVNNE